MATSTKKASRTPQEMLDLLEANFDLRLDTDGLSELVGRKLTDRSRISQTDEELYDIHAQSVAAAQRAAEDAEEAEAAEAIKSSPSGLTGRNVVVGQLLNHYRQLGLTELRISDIELIVSESTAAKIQLMVNKADKRSAAAKRKDPARLKPTTVISPSVLKELKYVLDVLATIEVQLKEDREALAQWTPPDATYVFDAVSEGSDIYYEDIYGNPATMSSRVYLKRQENDNPNVPTLFYFGDEARAERAALLDLIPDAAGPESQCSVCGEYRFGGNDADNRRLSHAKSRGDLYDNLLGEVSSLYMLVRRLGPNHPDRDPRHTRLIKDIDGFKQWAAKRRMAVDMLRMKEPSKARFLQAQLRDEIDAERTRLGIPDSVKV